MTQSNIDARAIIDALHQQVADLRADLRTAQQGAPVVPVLFRDRTGDQWEPGPSGWHLWGGGPAQSLEHIRDTYGPLTPCRVDDQ